jgi:PAS domain-containing protein
VETAPDNELAALRRRVAELSSFLETATIGLHRVAADGTILWANQAELDMLGYSKEQYFGRNIVVFHADRPVIDKILACLSRGERLRNPPCAPPLQGRFHQTRSDRLKRALRTGLFRSHSMLHARRDRTKSSGNRQFASGSHR